jgi:hypothetical protein
MGRPGNKYSLGNTGLYPPLAFYPALRRCAYAIEVTPVTGQVI